MGQIIDGKEIARQLDARTQADLDQLAELGVQPHLVAVQVGEDPASRIYSRRQARACRRLGIGYRILSLPEETTELELLRHLSVLNRSPEVTGILLQVPLPPQIHPRRARGGLHPDKDVEGVHPQNLGNLLAGKPRLVPCTAAAALHCARSVSSDLTGRDAVVVGASEIVGKPVALLLMQAMATVTVCHVATRDVHAHTRKADLVFVAVGKPHLLRGEHLREGATVIDVGINEVTEEDGASGIVGDVHTAEALQRGARVTPVPGGVGPVTVAMLLHNTVRAAFSGTIPV